MIIPAGVTNERIEEVKTELGLVFGEDALRETRNMNPVGHEVWKVLYDATRAAVTEKRRSEVWAVAHRFNIGFASMLRHVRSAHAAPRVANDTDGALASFRASGAVLEAPRAIAECEVG